MRAAVLLLVALAVLTVVGCSSDEADSDLPQPSASVLELPTSESTSVPASAASTPLEIPEVAGEIARAVVDVGGAESVVSGTAQTGTTLTVRAGCRADSGSAQARYTILDARPETEGTVEERTLASSTFPCDGQEYRDEMPAAFSGPLQILLTDLPEGVSEAYALLGGA
ncbi:hypothetical protein [Georgenia yuyongxinii]|uniref:Secreted protein n=1 Tax=Georgenia yuyongxinii TaxID=2589797 RepID=A0A552WWT1_9MICO|nr:hypothetical protein [Georgenia yuyongxinii]TRW47281.1 hypothetical protein FJ693_01945 [Georgenia yuyongxinii]